MIEVSIRGSPTGDLNMPILVKKPIFHAQDTEETRRGAEK